MLQQEAIIITAIIFKYSNERIEHHITHRNLNIDRRIYLFTQPKLLLVNQLIIASDSSYLYKLHLLSLTTFFQFLST
jgi:hypothetical protein